MKEEWICSAMNVVRLPKGYWKCPKGCNWKEKQFKHPPEVRAYFADRNRKQRERAQTS
jgi:ribosomal protein L37AE/L43A